MKFKEILLCKYGEIVLKGLNKKWFEGILIRDMVNRLKRYGNYKLESAQSIIYIEPIDENAFENMDFALNCIRKIFGISQVSRAAVVEKDMDIIRKAAVDYLPPFMENVKTFKAEARRSDKRFPLTSPQIASEIGGDLLEAIPNLKVDVNNPELTVKIEIRDHSAYIHAGEFKGAGGMPVGSNGKALLLLSGGIDSPVAGHMMAKRGIAVEALHFESFPYTSERAREKVIQLAGLMSEYCGKIKVHIISVTKIQEELRRCCDEDYFTLLLRRFMMRLAERTAKEYKCGALITGESLGQVASQTMKALEVTNSAVTLPVFRPCIGMDKEEIITIARKIGTFETSILPYEDCCTVFTPKHPRTKPDLYKVISQEEKIDITTLEEEAYNTQYTV